MPLPAPSSKRLSPVLLGICLLSPAAGADSPGWIDDPEVLRQQIPALQAQRRWTEFATPAEQALFAGPETVYPEIPATDYDLTGFDPTWLGSPVPAPGIHPRVLFSPQDIPGIKQRLEANRLGRSAREETRQVLAQTLFAPASPEGKIFTRLAAGDVADLTWTPATGTGATISAHWFAGAEPSLGTSTHTPYLPNLFAAAAFQCLLDGDQERGRQVAKALSVYCTLREPLVTAHVAECTRLHQAADTVWRSVSIVTGGNNLAFAYDLAAGWMDETEKAPVRRLIARATSGRLAYGMNGPARWAETNWASWDLEHYLTATAIEGEAGADPAIPPAARRCLLGYLQWGIDAQGTIFESNGKNGSGFHWAVLAMTALARRGDNLFGHPHFRRHPASQVQTFIPAGGLSLSNGTWGNTPPICGSYYLAFFPQDPCAGFLQRQLHPELATPESADKKPLNLKKASLLTPGHSLGATLFTCLDGPADPGDVAAQRQALKLPPDVLDPQHGLLISRSGDGPDALGLHFEARADLSTVGHQHHDAGHFYLAALGEMWAVESGAKSFNSSDHNVVRVDDLGLADAAYPPRVDFVGGATGPGGALATADLSNAYNFAWVNPTQFQWSIPAAKDWKISVETNPEVVAFFRGTQHYPMRIWGTDHWHQEWGPTMRIAAKNPVQSAFRTAGLVRGRHPYALIVDDLAKGDNAQHRFDWTIQVPGNTRLAQASLPPGNPAAAILVKDFAPTDWRAIDTPTPPPKGAPALLVSFLDQAAPTTDATLGNTVNNAEQPFRLVTTPYAGIHPGQFISRTRFQATLNGTQARFRLLLLPYRIGDALPAIAWDAAKAQATVRWADQTDVIACPVDGPRTRVAVSRDGQAVVTGK